MENGPSPEIGRDDRATRREELLGLIRGRLLEGAFDVLANHQTAVLEIVSGQLRFEHMVTVEEAAILEQTVWSAGEDQALDALVGRIDRQLEQSGFPMSGDQLDITVRLRQSSQS